MRQKGVYEVQMVVADGQGFTEWQTCCSCDTMTNAIEQVESYMEDDTLAGVNEEYKIVYIEKK